MPDHKHQTSLHTTIPTNLSHQIFNNRKLPAQLESHFYPDVTNSKFHSSLHSFTCTATTLHTHARTHTHTHTHIWVIWDCVVLKQEMMAFFLNLIWKVYDYFETHILVHKANTPTPKG